MSVRRTRPAAHRSRKSLRRSREKSRQRNLLVETLEPRRLLAVGPQLIGIQPNGDELLEDGDERNVAPSTLTFRFDGNQVIDASTLDGIELTRSGKDGVFGDANDILVQPGYMGLGDTPNEVVMRFSESLPDDHYRIEIFGSGATALRNDQGEPFNNGEDQRVDFRLDLVHRSSRSCRNR